jgi:hypothetical protein
VNVAANLSERELRIGILKLALTLVVGVALLAIGSTWLAGWGHSIAINFLLISMALTFLANGFAAVLKILDWFEARKRHHG